MKGATLFSGIGAPECAAPFIDWCWSADIDEFANAVRAHHWPDVPDLGDVGEIDGQAVERPDVIVFGSPCQSFSVAGKRLGLGDPRGNLALVALSLVAELRPRWFVFENVPGLLSSADGEDFAAFLRAVRQCGYTGAYRVLDAQHFGVPQRRRRVFFVGHLGDDWRPSAAVLFEPESLSGHSAPGREEGQDVAPTIAARTRGGGGLGTDFDCDGGLIPLQEVTGRQSKNQNGPGIGIGGDVMYTLQSGQQHGVALCATGDQTHALTAEGFDASEDGTGRGHPIVAALNGYGEYGAALPLLRSTGGDAGGGSVALIADAIAQTADAVDRWVETLRGRQPMVRRLTPTECERLQGFPDGFTAIPWRGKPAPDGRRYKALGNSMAVPCIRWILERLWIVDMETREWRAAA